MTAAGERSEAEADGFAAARETFEGLVGWLDGGEAAELDHAALEAELEGRGRELLRQLTQDHLDVRAMREARRDDVGDGDGVARGNVEVDHERTLTTVFGEVVVRRLAYRKRGHPNLHPADAAVNLPAEKHSHGLRRLAAREACRGSFDEAVAAVERACGQQLGKRPPPPGHRGHQRRPRRPTRPAHRRPAPHPHRPRTAHPAALHRLRPHLHHVTGPLPAVAV